MSKPRASDSGGVHRDALTAGQLLKHRALGTDAFYRVLAENSRGAEVEVVDAPGLESGSRFTFSRKDVLAMELVEAV